MDNLENNKPQQKFKHRNPTEDNQSKISPLTRKDIFVMSLFGFFAGGLLLGIIALVVGSVTGYISLDIFPGEEEVAGEELPVIGNTTNTTTEVVVETVVNETVVEEEPEDPCDIDVTLNLDETYKWNKRAIILKLVDTYAAKISVGGKSDLLSKGDTVTVNGLPVTLVNTDTTAETAEITIGC